MKNLKLALAGLMVVSFAACGSGGGHDGVDNIKPAINRGITITNSKYENPKTKDSSVTKGNTLTVDGKHRIGLKSDDKNIRNIENNGTINVKNSNSIGMVVRDKSNKGFNNKGSNIDVNGKYSFGMYSNGEKAEITNNGNINLNGNDQVGMYAGNHSNATNNGTIDLTKAHNGVGMWADNHATITNSKNGVIILPGSGQDITDNTGIKNGELGHGNHGNIGMKATNHGKIVNKGHIEFK